MCWRCSGESGCVPGWELAWMNRVDKSLQEIQGVPEDVGGRTEELEQPIKDSQAGAKARCKPEVEKVRRMVETAMLNADEGKMMKWKAEAEKRAAEEARVAEFKAKAEEARCKAEAAEAEAEAAKVVILEAATGLE